MNTMILEKELNTFAHEVKNPLTICNGYLEMLMTQDTDTKETYLNIIKEEIARTLNIINNYSKEKTYELLDLNLLLEEINSLLKNYLLKRNIDIILLDDDECFILGNYDELKQVFINLIKNSVEAKQKDKLLIVISTKEKNDSYELTITDNGIGMTQEELLCIGEDYYTTKENGTGLGIPYCKKVIESHKGTIKYESEKNIGTRVTITLPKKSPKTFSSSNNY